MGAKSSTLAHPYYPEDLFLPAYKDPVHSATVVLSVFSAVVSLVAGIAVTIAKRSTFRGRNADVAIFVWFIVSGVIHTLPEAGYVLYPDFLSDEGQHGAVWAFVASFWKEYARADSRYAWREPGTVAVEAITAFLVGPSCFILAYGMLRNRQWVLPLTKVLAVCQMYGVLVYFIPILPGLEVCRPEAVYRYVYLAFANLAWLFAPAAILWHTTQKVTKALRSKED